MSDDARSDWERVKSRADYFVRNGWQVIGEQREPPRIRLRTKTGPTPATLGRGLFTPVERRRRTVCRDVFIGDDGQIAWQNVPCEQEFE